MAVVGGVLVLAMAIACLRHHAQQLANGKLGLGPEGGVETHFDYQVFNQGFKCICLLLGRRHMETPCQHYASCAQGSILFLS